MNTEMTCQQCGQTFRARQRVDKPRKYCSRQCRDAAQTTRVRLTCVQCRREFERKAYQRDWSQERGPFCSMPCYGAWQSRHIRGATAPSFDPERHVHLACAMCGAAFWRNRVEFLRKNQELAFCSRQCFQSFARIEWTGQANPSWRGGRSYYRGPSWREARKLALERDSHRCVDCSSEGPLVVHHLVPFAACAESPEANALDNLVTLCRACHLERHRCMAP